MTAYETAFAFEAEEPQFTSFSISFVTCSLDDKKLECIADDASD
jgi:hypothetical protein